MQFGPNSQDLVWKLIKSKLDHHARFGTCCIDEKRGLRRDCAYAQSRQSLRFTYSQSNGEGEGSDLKLDDMSTWTFIGAFAHA